MWDPELFIIDLFLFQDFIFSSGYGDAFVFSF